jgi:hypothetical protein
MSKRVAAITVMTVLVLVFWVIVDERDAEGSTCRGVDQVWALEEGSVGFDTAKIDVTGALCSAPSGYFDQAASQLDMSIRSTVAGRAAGFKYWKRSGPYKTEDTPSFTTWRTYFAYTPCVVKVVNWVCFPTGRFAVNVRYVNTADQSPIRVRRWISNRNEFAGGVHFASAS